MGHAQNKKQFIFAEIAKPNHKLSKLLFHQNIICFGWVMNAFLFCLMVFCEKVSFLAIAAVGYHGNEAPF